MTGPGVNENVPPQKSGASKEEKNPLLGLAIACLIGAVIADLIFDYPSLVTALLIVGLVCSLINSSFDRKKKSEQNKS